MKKATKSAKASKVNSLRAFCERCCFTANDLAVVEKKTAILFYEDCAQPDLFLRVCESLPNLRAAVERCGFGIADLAVRKYAPAALDAAGFSEKAAVLRERAKIVDARSAQDAALIIEKFRWELEGPEFRSTRRVLEAAAEAAFSAAGASADKSFSAWAARAIIVGVPVERSPALNISAFCRAQISRDAFLEACRNEGVES